MHAQESVEVLIRENGTERQESIEARSTSSIPVIWTNWPQIVGFVEEADKNELIIESEKGRFTY